MIKSRSRGADHVAVHTHLSITALCALAIVLGIPVNGWAAERSNQGGADVVVAQSHEGTHDVACDIEVELTEAAERQLGGALYDGPTPTPDQIMATMTTAHRVHHPQHGGAFAMAPNKMHHVEVVFSEACRVRVYLYNAFTKHIRVDRFMAFVEFIPRDEDQFEVIRFVRPAKNGDYLGTGVPPEIDPPFDIHLFMKFPGSDAVELFTVKPNFEQRKLFVGVGKVVSVDKGGPELVIDHDAIPGYMSAMTMPYTVSGSELLDRVEPGMHIRFKVDAGNGIIVVIEPMNR